MKYINTQKWL